MLPLAVALIVLTTAVQGAPVSASHAAAPASAAGVPVRAVAGSPGPHRFGPGAGASRAVRVDLYAPGDFVSQTNLVQCVGASMQMMLNMIDGTPDRTAATQRRLFDLARSLRDPTVSADPRWHGASAAGWAIGLTASGAGPYAVRSAATLAEALSLAASAIARTGRPVGLLVWQGAHAWVMSGFEATSDPADRSALVTAVRVLDPLYPRPVVGRWGPGAAPDARLTVAQVGRVFVPYRPHGRNARLRDRFVLVLPLAPSVPARLRNLVM